MVDIYLDASGLGIYPPLFTSPSGDSCMIFVVVNLNYYLNDYYSFPLFLYMLMYGNVYQNKRKLKFNWKKINYNIFTS